MRPYTSNYSGRLTDVEVLQTITAPRGLTALHTSLTTTPVKMITGMQKMAQRFTILLLTRLGDIHFDQDAGTTFIVDMFRGASQSSGSVGSAFAFASTDVLQQMRQADRDVELYGPIPADEQIVNATLESFDVDYSTATLRLRISLENLEGSAYTYVMPVTVART